MTPRLLITLALAAAAGCGGRGGSGSADAGQDGLAACQIDWLDAGGDSRELRSFDNRGRFVHAVWSLDGGAVNMLDDFSYDDDRLVEGRYTNPDGTLREGDRLYWDDQHRLTRYTADGSYASGPFADGRLDDDERYTYDASGHLARVDFDDANGQPIPGQVETLTWDAQGCATGDDLVTPTSHDRATLAYRSGCVLERIDHDYGADGTIDATETWTFDDRGRVTAYHGLAGDDRSYLYGDDGRLAQIVFATRTEKFTYCPVTLAAAERERDATLGLPRPWRRRLDRAPAP